MKRDENPVNSQQCLPSVHPGRKLTERILANYIKSRQPPDPFEILNAAMAPIRSWAGKLSDIPDRKQCDAAAMAILRAAQAERPTLKKKRTLGEAIKILDQKRRKARVGKLMRELTALVHQSKPKGGVPKLEKQYQIALEEIAREKKIKWKPDALALKRRQFLNAVREYQSRFSAGNIWCKAEKKNRGDDEKFQEFAEFLTDPRDTNIRAQIAEMILARLQWLHSWDSKTDPVRRFLFEAGEWTEPTLEILRNDHEENIRRERGNQKKRRQRARTARNGREKL